MRCDIHCPPRGGTANSLVTVAVIAASAVVLAGWVTAFVEAAWQVLLIGLGVALVLVAPVTWLLVRVLRRVLLRASDRVTNRLSIITWRLPREAARWTATPAITGPPRALPVRQPLGLPPAARPVQGAIIDSREVQ